MRRRNREINIFNMSALDLFASALGAFILMFVIVMPYYLNPDKEAVRKIIQENAQLKADLSKCQAQVTALQGQVAELQGQIQNLQQQLASCEQQKQALQTENTQLKQDQSQKQARLQALERENAGLKQENAGFKERLSKTFLAVVMKWSTEKVDIDLYVKDPSGNIFSFHNQYYSGTPAELSVDTKEGPGIEIWEHPSAPPGDYVVFYDFFKQSPARTPTEITGNVYFRDGAKKLETTRLNAPGENKQVAVITVTPEGDVNVH
jgi:uncharacterized protein YfaP (DUF2135 family)